MGTRNRILTFICIACSIPYYLHAQTNDTTLLSKEDYSSYILENEITPFSLPLITMGFIVKDTKKDFKSVRNNYDPHFHEEWDNYSQYLPLLMTWGLKIGGVENRSDWKRLAVSNILSAGTMAGMVNLIKYTAREMRPDGTQANSFPSGHTATAFMAATILHKEYGMTRSPFYSIGGYILASATGFMRILNNRHWISDVFVGAGLGILSADLGYMIADIIFKDRELLRGLRKDLNTDLTQQASFFGLLGGISFLSSGASIRDLEENLHLDVDFGIGTSVGLEGAYFFTPYLGGGGRVRLTTFPIKLFGKETGNNAKDFRGETMGFYGFDLGIYSNFPVSKCFSLEAKVVGGPQFITNTHFYKTYLDEQSNTLIEEKFLDVSAKTGFKVGVGISATYAYGSGTTFKVFVDYDHIWNHYNLVWFKDNIEKEERLEERGNGNLFTAGISMNIAF